MGWGMAIGIGWPNASAGVSYVKKLIKTFKERVLSYPNSIFEAEPCLDATLTELNAIGLLKQASLIITPNAYNEGVLYDVVPNTTLGDMTVVRATTATRVNSAGLIEIVPRNLLTYSNTFTNAAWTKANASISANVIASPNGNIDASKLIEDTANSSHYFRSDFILVNSGSSYTYSIFAKKAERNFTLIFDSYINSGYWFDLNNGIVGTKYGTGAVTANIQNFGNGWYKCSITFTAHSGGYALLFNNVTNADNVVSYTGNGTSGIYIYGAQLEQGSTATEYFPTTTRLNIPRIDYTNGSCPSLLVEPQRTNLLTYSNDYSNASWSKIGITAVLNSQLNPEGINSTYNISNTTLGDSYLEKQGLQTTAGNYTMSVFIKNIDNLTTSQLMAVHLVEGSVTSQLTYTWATNTFTLGGTNAISGSSILYNNGWVRLTFTYSIGSSVSNHWTRLYANQNLSITKSALVYGFQLEAGSYATSYIPTVATSVTRNADVISKTGISSLIGQTEGTIFCEINTQVSTDNNWFQILDGSPDNWVFIGLSGNKIRAFVRFGAVTIFDSNTFVLTNGVSYKAAIAYKNGDLAFYINGVQIATASTPFTITNPISYLAIGFLLDAPTDAAKYKQGIIFKTRLSNTELVQLTTI